ncbi:MAG: hypothetical protein ABJG41_14390 [Cyclobacteriaceae bacterium]
MRVWITRFLFLLISANVVYGTHGDIYADQVQGLIKPNSEIISYSPGINTDLFIASHNSKESNRADRAFFRSCIALSEWETVVFHPVVLAGLANGMSNGTDETAYRRNCIMREMIFPHHHFS